MFFFLPLEFFWSYPLTHFENQPWHCTQKKKKTNKLQDAQMLSSRTVAYICHCRKKKDGKEKLRRRRLYSWQSWKRRVFLSGTGCTSHAGVRDAALPGCSGPALTPAVEPRGTFTTDLASGFQRGDGRPLRSVSTVPSSFWITSPHPPFRPLKTSNRPVLKINK